MKIEGAPALVTGGASGLGAATARALAKAGAKVAVLDLNEEQGHAVASEIGGIFSRCDVVDGASVNGALAYSRSAHGLPRILVNCAGVGPSGRVVSREGPMPLEQFEKVIRVNLLGTFNMIRLAGAVMSRAVQDSAGHRGVIVSTASVAAYEGQVGQAAYAASKGGIVSMTLPIAREFARFGIRVLAVAPGMFKTPMLDNLSAETQLRLTDNIPYPARFGDPAEFADLVVALVANDYVNGETIRIDGGLRMQAT